MESSATYESSSLLQSESAGHFLRDDALRSLLMAAFVVGCAWLLFLVIVLDDRRPSAGLAPVSLIAISALVHMLAHRNVHIARFAFPAALILVILAYTWVDSGSLAALLVPLVVFMVGAISSQGGLIGIACGSCLALLMVSLLQHGRVTPIVSMGIFASACATLVSWFITRNTHIALEWATQSHTQAQQHLEALRARRAELRRLSDMLHHNQERLHYLNLRLEQAKVAAEEAYRTKQHFVANVSHELRTPLNLITGFSEMMVFSPESYGGVRLPPQYHEDAMEIYRNSKHLLGLVEDVLALAQLEAGQLIVQREPAELSVVVHEATETIRPLIESKGISLEVQLDADLPTVSIDQGRIRQVLLNLLNNAYRFTEYGHITVQAYRLGSEVVVQVRDTGVGIAAEDLPRIFEEFHALSKGPAARRGGFGLGLSISRRLVEAHGGKLWAGSAVGQGSCFYMTLPLASDGAIIKRPTLVHTTPHPSSERSRPVILAIGQGCEVFDRYLADYQVIHSRPEEALDAYEQYLPVAIWVNDQVQGDGLPSYLAPVLRVAPELPVIACRVPTREDIAHKLQADLFLAKPVTREQVARAIAQLSAQKPIYKVMIIDDDVGMVRLLKRVLASVLGPSGSVVEACGGQEGLDLLASVHPDVVLLDLVMPEISGYDILEFLHGHPEYRHTRVLLMSGADLEDASTLTHVISVRSQSGFSLHRALSVVKLLVGEISEKVLEARVA